MKILIFFCLFIGITKCEQGRPHEKCWKQCDWSEYKELVKCPVGPVAVPSTTTEPTPEPTPAPAPCTCWKKDQETEDDDCTAKVAQSGSIDWKQCQEIAQKMSENGILNTHFRWDDSDLTHPDETYCYLLEDCKRQIDSHCAPFEGAHCVAGETAGCDVEPDPKCKRPVWADKGLHWSCSFGEEHNYNPYQNGAEDLEDIPTGTTCQTGSECKTWKWKDEAAGGAKPKVASVLCTTEWESADSLSLLTSDDVPILPGDVNDAMCDCEKLDIPDENLNSPGLSLICDTVYDPADGGILNENACTLLCDGHFVMYIECYKGDWMNTAAYPFTPVTTEMITC